MDGTTLQDNMKGVNKDAMSEGEKFVIEKITKLVGDTWLFQMRFQYGDHDLPVPVPICLRAGDTPVFTPSEVPISGFGNYTARVLIYGEQYAECGDRRRAVVGRCSAKSYESVMPVVEFSHAGNPPKFRCCHGCDGRRGAGRRWGTARRHHARRHAQRSHTLAALRRRRKEGVDRSD